MKLLKSYITKIQSFHILDLILIIFFKLTRRIDNKLEVRLRYWILKILGHRNFKRFIVLSRSRTGSNLLISFLNSHPNVRAKGEIFQTMNGKNARDVLKEAFSNQPIWIKAVGFKIFYYHPLDGSSNNICNDDSDIWNELIKMEHLYIIHLKRSNIIRTLVSLKIAQQTNMWKTKKGNNISYRNKTKAVKFTLEELEKGFRETRYWEEQGDRRFSHHPIQTIYYEDLVRNPEIEFKKITELLNLRYKRPLTILKKQNPEKLSELIVNYNELKDTFEGTKWEFLFAD